MSRSAGPATEAGRALLDGITEHTPMNVLVEMVIAIEREAGVDPRHRPNDLDCPCWGCHLNAEAEDATY